MDKSLIGISGAHFVAAEMSRKGYVVTLTSRNTEGIDILASNKDGTKTVAIQVKTTEGKTEPRAWILSKKSENLKSANLFYVFVTLKKDQIPDFFIVSSADVAHYIQTDHEYWMNKPGKQGQAHKESDIRKFRDTEGKYLNKWNLLDLD